MKKLLSILSIVGMVLLFTGCGEKVIIENGEVGKQLSTEGLEKDVRSPGAFRMESCFLTACPKLVRLSVSENSKTVPGKFFITKSDLEMQLQLEIQYSVKKDNESINEIFSRIKAVPSKESRKQLLIPEQKVYNTFIKPILRDTVRVALNEYSIDEIMQNLSEVRTYVENQVQLKLKETPVKVVNLSFGKVGYPDAILKAKEDFAKIELDKATKMKAMSAELQIMEKELEINKKRAQMALEVDKIVADNMNPNLAQYMLLDGINKSAENGTSWALNSNIVFRKDQ